MSRRRNSSLLSPPMLIISLPIIALLILFFILHPFLSATSQIMKPNSVKKSYSIDSYSINTILVLFAILCGVFARGNDDGNNNTDTENDVGKENYDSTPNPQPWFENSERKMYSDPPIRGEASGGGRLRRNSSSYPDLRNESIWGNNERLSFFDDYEISKYRSPAVTDDHVPLRRWRSEIEEKEIPVDTILVGSSPPLPSTPPPPPPLTKTAAFVHHKYRRVDQSVGRKERVQKVIEQSSPVTPPTAANSRHKPRRTNQSVGREERVDTVIEKSSPQPPPPTKMAAFVHHKYRRVDQSVGRKERVQKVIEQSSPVKPPPPPTAANSRCKPRRTNQSVGREERVDRAIEKSSPPPPPPPPLPPPSPPVKLPFRSEQKQGKLERRKSNATKEIKMVLASLYNNRKRKRQEKITKSHEQIDNLQHFPPESSHFEIPSTPPPPPPPPPPSVFHGIFKIKSKSKKIHSVPPPPPPPPFPKSAILSSKRKIHTPPPAPPIPPLESSPRRIPSTSSRPPFPNSHNQSSLIQIPSPPPPPPSGSANSSRCSSPGLDNDVETPSNPVTETLVDGLNKEGVSNGGSVFCPSPDVNVKADTFIARLRCNWQLEKLNSLRESEMRVMGRKTQAQRFY